MEELFEQLKRAITPAQDSAAKRTATAMDGISDRMADAAAASYIASVAEDEGFEESAHPREAKGGKGGGRFRTSGKTIEREDDLSEKDKMPQLDKSGATECKTRATITKTVAGKGWLNGGKGEERYVVDREYEFDDGWHSYESLSGLGKEEAEREAKKTEKTVRIDNEELGKIWRRNHGEISYF